MAYINSSGGISSGGPSTRSGSGASDSNSDVDFSDMQDVSDDSSNQFDTGYSGNAVVAADGSLIATPGTEITQVGEAVDAGEGQITGSATIEETKEAVAEVGGNPSEVGQLVPDPSADSEGNVLDVASEVKDSVEQTYLENQAADSLANTIGSITRNRESPLGNNNEPDSDFNPTETVVGDGDGGNDYSITGTVDENISDADNTGAQTVPGVSIETGFSPTSFIIPLIAIVAVIFGFSEYNE
jgi:hypothetical protein